MNVDGPNDKNRTGVWHIASVTKQTSKDPHKMLASMVDNKHAFNSACVVRLQLRMARSTTRMQPWEIFCGLPNKMKSNDLSQPRTPCVASFEIYGKLNRKYQMELC